MYSSVGRKLAYNRRVKFGLKITNRLGKMSENVRGDFFDSHCMLEMNVMQWDTVQEWLLQTTTFSDSVNARQQTINDVRGTYQLVKTRRQKVFRNGFFEPSNCGGQRGGGDTYPPPCLYIATVADADPSRYALSDRRETNERPRRRYGVPVMYD